MRNYDKIKELLSIDLDNTKHIQGVPWAYSNSDEKFLEWCGKTSSYFKFEENSLNHQQNLLNQNQVASASKPRIQQFVKDKHSHLKQMKKLLTDFLDDSNTSALVDNQNILSYQNNIFRDWCWGIGENKTYADYILNQITDETKNVLVLGAGSCGLSYELAKKTKANIISIDINPYLLLVANKIFNKKYVKLFEFIDYPKDINNISIKREIKPIQEDLSNHFILFSNFEDLPFKESSFDLVVGCWFYDIIPQNLEKSLLHTNSFLNPDGRSIFIGPSNFHKKAIDQRLTPNEIVSTFKELYQDVSHSTEQVSYLDNPENSYKRLEDILFLTGSTPNKSNKIQLEMHKEDFIHPTAELLGYKQKIEVFNRILKYIDKPITYSALSKNLEKEFGFSQEEAIYYTESVIKKLNLEVN